MRLIIRILTWQWGDTIQANAGSHLKAAQLKECVDREEASTIARTVKHMLRIDKFKTEMMLSLLICVGRETGNYLFYIMSKLSLSVAAVIHSVYSLFCWSINNLEVQFKSLKFDVLFKSNDIQFHTNKPGKRGTVQPMTIC